MWLPIELLVGNPDFIDESEVTVYIPAIDDHTICGEDGHVVIAIGPSLEPWDTANREDYMNNKESETRRLMGVLEKRFPGFADAVRFTN